MVSMVATKSSMVDRVFAQKRSDGDGVGLTEPHDADLHELLSHLIEIDELRADGFVALEEALFGGAFGAFENRRPVFRAGIVLGRCACGLGGFVEMAGRARMRGRRRHGLGLGKRPAPGSDRALRGTARNASAWSAAAGSGAVAGSPAASGAVAGSPAASGAAAGSPAASGSSAESASGSAAAATSGSASASVLPAASASGSGDANSAQKSCDGSATADGSCSVTSACSTPVAATGSASLASPGSCASVPAASWSAPAASWSAEAVCSGWNHTAND